MNRRSIEVSAIGAGACIEISYDNPKSSTAVPLDICEAIQLIADLSSALARQNLGVLDEEDAEVADHAE